MLEKFRIWYTTYYTEITWFLVGWLLADGFHFLAVGQYGYALFDFILAGFNIWVSKRD